MSKIASFKVQVKSAPVRAASSGGAPVPPAYAREQANINRVTQRAIHVRPRGSR